MAFVYDCYKKRIFKSFISSSFLTAKLPLPSVYNWYNTFIRINTRRVHLFAIIFSFCSVFLSLIFTILLIGHYDTNLAINKNKKSNNNIIIILYLFSESIIFFLVVLCRDYHQRINSLGKLKVILLYEIFTFSFYQTKYYTITNVTKL